MKKRYNRRYDRNGTTIPKVQNEIIRKKRVLVAGCGGLGGYVIEMLARTGIGHLTVVDPDIFDETNLNRQIFSKETLLGTPKSVAAVSRVKAINSEVSVTGYQAYIDKSNARQLGKGHDIIIDALDNIPSRFVLQEAAEDLNIPLVHGAISGWYGQMAVLYPGDRLFDIIYKNTEGMAMDNTPGNPSFTPAAIASFQVSETIKVLTGNSKAMKHQILYLDMRENQTELIEIQK